MATARARRPLLRQRRPRRGLDLTDYVSSMRYEPVPLEFTRLDAEEALRRSREMYGLLATRRSVRHFSDEPVPRELIENAIHTAGMAPSGANQQPWTFVVVSDQPLKEKLREAAEQEERLLYEERA